MGKDDFMGIFDSIFQKISGREADGAEATGTETAYIRLGGQDGPYLNQWKIKAGEEIIFYNPKRNIKKTIIDADGKICDFPGIANRKLLTPYYVGYRGKTVEDIRPYAGILSEFDIYENEFIMLWLIQMDDREEHELEIRLYSVLDDEGNFKFPFRIYRIGVYGDRWIGQDWEEEKARELEAREKADAKAKAEGKTKQERLSELIDGAVKVLVEKGWPYALEIDIPESFCHALISIGDNYEGGFALNVGVRKGDSDRLVSNYITDGMRDELIKELQSEQVRDRIVSCILRLEKKEMNR